MHLDMIPRTDEERACIDAVTAWPESFTAPLAFEAILWSDIHDRPMPGLIWAYKDLPLHDMGPALADDRPEGRANGQEWRTAPFWGIGMTETVSGHTHFLRDGRARSLLDAVLWHGGEAQAARDRAVEMPPEDRAALIRFLESL